MMRLWKKDSGTALYAMYLGGAVSIVIIPKFTGLFVDPRLSGTRSTLAAAQQTIHCNISQEYVHNSTTHYSAALPPKPKYPAAYVLEFWIIGAFGALFAAVFVAYYLYKIRFKLQYVEPRVKVGENRAELLDTFSSSLSPKSCSPSKPTIATLLMVSSFLYYAALIPVYRIFPKLIFSYARDAACFSVDHATSLHSIFFTLIAVGRLLAFLLSPVINSKYIMQVCFILFCSSH